MTAKRKDTFYQILGVASNVGSPEIKRAYRKLVKSIHPDVGHADKSTADRDVATERMMRINEAYETLMDRSKRSAYDCLIGISRTSRVSQQERAMVKEDEAREGYLRRVFHPARQMIMRALNSYQRHVKQLSLDIYDEELVADFERYVDSFEEALRKGSNSLATQDWPKSLDAAVHMMRYCIAQAVDGLEEMRRFCANFDYDHLTMAQNLVSIAQELAKQALRLTRY